MPAKRYRVRLTAEERKELDGQVNTGTGSARRLRRARILLMADEAQAGGGWCDAEIAKALGAHSNEAVCHSRDRSRPHPHATETETTTRIGWRRRSPVGACSAAPDGQEQWTLQMLADKLVELEVVERISRETVRTTLKKTNLSPG